MIRELAGGIDGLYLSGRYALSDSFKARFEAARERASVETTTITLGGVEFGVSARGLTPGYPWRADHEAGAIGFNVSGDRPAIRVQTRATALHSIGAEPTARFFEQILRDEFGVPALTPSRVDLFCDLQGYTVSIDRRDDFVCRAAKLNGFENNRAFNGLSFGSRKTGTILCRIYDKTAEIGGKPSYWFDVWGPAYSPDEPVTRIEFEIARTGLRELGVNTLDDLFGNVGGMWGHLTERWLTERTPTGDSNRTRWSISPGWRHVQQVSLRERHIPIDRVKAARRAASVATIIPALRGYLASLAAVDGAANLGGALELAEEHILAYDDIRGELFDEVIKSKRQARRYR